MSKSILVGIISFAGGVVVGGAAVYKYIMSKNEADQEKKAEAIKAQLENYYETKYGNKPACYPIGEGKEAEASDELIHFEPVNKDQVPYNMGKKDYSKYQKVVDKYRNRNEVLEEVKPIEENPMFEIVDSDNLDEDWDVLGFTLYADGIITDENDDPLDDVETHLGNALDFFDRDSNLAMYVKNNNLQSYYEISYDDYTYAESHVDEYR